MEEQVKREKEKTRKKGKGKGKRVTKRMSTEESEEERQADKKSETRCPISHPAHPHTLLMRFKRFIKSGCFACDTHWCDYITDFFYHCTICNVDFHQHCLSRAKKITHPFHLQHPLTYTRLDDYTGTYNLIQTQSPSIFDKCGWCGNKCGPWWVYSCSICSFCLCVPCSENIPLLTITNPKSHHHPLFFFPRPLLVPCDACGSVIASEASYACFQCNYMVHQSCDNSPRVIKLTRHSHRLFYTPFLPPAVLTCGVCYRAIDIRFGQYLCRHEDCSSTYVVHSKCATHSQIWDGRELEWAPEGSKEIEDVASFKKITDDLIKYFDHKHFLKLKEYDGGHDSKKQCQACILPMDSHRFYTCTRCDYSLHKVCADLPRKLDHVLHKHRLILDTAPNYKYYEFMTCSTCSRVSNGFRYMCERGCQVCNIDIRCILVPPLATHKCHEHPLFTSLSYGSQREVCSTCRKAQVFPRLHCTLCDFVMCYKCATVPTEILYKFDEHPLVLCYGKGAADVGIYWCEVCEDTINQDDWFYTCNKCCVTVHRLCIFGGSTLMKAGSTFDRRGFEVKSIPNTSCTRRICAICERRCIASVCYALPNTYEWFEKAFCSFYCLHDAISRIYFVEDI